jgi:hypothetical protein
MIGSGNQEILNYYSKFEKLRYWYYSWEGFLKYATDMDSGGKISIPVS